MSLTEFSVIPIFPWIPCNLVFISEMIFVLFHWFPSRVQSAPASYIFLLFVHSNCEFWNVWLMVSLQNAITCLIYIHDWMLCLFSCFKAFLYIFPLTLCLCVHGYSEVLILVFCFLITIWKRCWPLFLLKIICFFFFRISKSKLSYNGGEKGVSWLIIKSTLLCGYPEV